MAKEKIVEENVVTESEAKKAFRKVMEAYKKQNPVKYEIKVKNGEFDRKLASL